jgi:hypothetical protein
MRRQESIKIRRLKYLFLNIFRYTKFLFVVVYFMLIIAAVDIIIVLSYTRFVRITFVFCILVIAISFGLCIFS